MATTSTLVKNLKLSDGVALAADVDTAIETAVETAISGLGHAMEFIGTSTTDPVESGATITGRTTFKSGDVCRYGNKEFVYDDSVTTGSKWVELGDETSYAVKGSITNSDIASNAAIAYSKLNIADGDIAQSKINGLSTALGSKLESVAVTNGGTGDNAKTSFTVSGTEASVTAANLRTALDVAKGAQVNVLDGVVIGNGTASTDANGNVTITSKKVTLGALAGKSSISNSDVANDAGIAYSKLSIGDGDIAQSKINGLSTALSNKVDAVSGKGLSTNDLTDALKTTYDTAASNLATLKTAIEALTFTNNDNTTIAAIANAVAAIITALGGTVTTAAS